MKTVIEWSVVAVILFMAVFPYIGYYRDNKTLKNSFYDNGAGYMEVFLSVVKHRFFEVMGTLVLLFLLCAWSVVIALACAVYFTAVAFAAIYAQRQGYKTRDLVD